MNHNKVLKFDEFSIEIVGKFRIIFKFFVCFLKVENNGVQCVAKNGKIVQ